MDIRMTDDAAPVGTTKGPGPRGTRRVVDSERCRTGFTVRAVPACVRAR